MASAKSAKEFKPKARSDAYTGMLLLSLLILIAGAVLIYLDFSQYPQTKPAAAPKVSAIGNPEAGKQEAAPPAPAPPGGPPAAKGAPK